MAFQHKKESGMLSVEGRCTECDASWKGGGVALQATRHFNNTGHKIHVQQTIWWTWEPKLDAKGKARLKKRIRK